MHEYIDSNGVYGTVRMAIDAGCLVLVVEGNGDRDLLKRHCSSDISIYSAAGKPAALEAARQLDGHDFNRARFLVDRDYDDYKRDTQAYPSNVIASKCHDILVDILSSSPGVLLKAVDSIYIAHGRSSSVDTGQGPKESIEQALSMARDIAAIRIANARHLLGLDFKRINFKDLNPGSCSIEKIFGMLTCAQGSRPLPTDVLNEAMAFRNQMESVGYQLIGDHDLLESLSRVLELRKSDNRDKVILISILSAIQCEVLPRVEWYQDLQHWAAKFSKTAFLCPCPDEAA